MSTELWILAAAIALGVGMYVLRGTGDVISGPDARGLVSKGATLVDVRTPAEFAAGHIEGAINIPVDQVSKRLPEFGARSDAIVLYCRSGARSSSAQSILERHGFSDVHNLGAMSRW